MDLHAQFQQMLDGNAPILALAPMQDVTDLPFMRLMAQYGGADLYYTEYFRVRPEYKLEKFILRSITENNTGRPVIAQMIGNDIDSLVKFGRELQEYPIVAVDLNLGCPAPVVYKKCAGGGLLRDPQRVDRILGALRDAIEIKFTVKTRIGFDTPDVLDELLPIFAKHNLDLLTVHGRTVKEGYRSAVHYDLIAKTVDAMACPVLANGNVYSAQKSSDVLKETNAAGLMIGRGAIRNPWLFEQCRQHHRGEAVKIPTGRDTLGYIRTLFEAVRPEYLDRDKHVKKMKKYMNYVGIGIEPTGQFLHQIRRAQTEVEFFSICEEFLNHNDPMPLEPYALALKPGDFMAGQQN